jgi:hypothetical protein
MCASKREELRAAFERIDSNWKDAAREWPAFSAIWKAETARLRSGGSQVFMDVECKGCSEREAVATWWPIDGFYEIYDQTQTHWLQCPNTHGMMHGPAARGQHRGYILNAGIAATLEMLEEAGHDRDIIGAILVAAAVHQDAGDGILWEQWRGLAAIGLAAEAYLKARGIVVHWPHPVRYTLPDNTLFIGDYGYFQDGFRHRHVFIENGEAIDTLPGLVKLLAQGHAKFLKEWQAVRISFPGTLSPKWAERVGALESRRAAVLEEQRQVSKRVELQCQAQQRRIDEENRILDLDHPRRHEWSRLKRDELQTLVWSKATSSLAQEFGVTDSAIGKVCRKLSIPKPPRGFWEKVYAGKLPHPNGKPA